LNTPVLLLIFNRLHTTKKVIEVLQRVRPARVYIAADGARPSKDGEVFVCNEVRDYVLNAINWECEIITNFQEHNLGCGKHVSNAISWFFTQEEQGIILEDDCIPHIDFFNYCTELLEKYKDNETIFTIGGNNFQVQTIGNASYYFSTYGHIWGWATWKRAWEKYQYDLNTYDEKTMRKRMKHYFKNLQTFDYWWRIFELMRTDPVDTWDYQWSFCQWYNKGLSIMPNVNLVSNIGHGVDATHTKDFVEGILEHPIQALPEIKHPTKIALQRTADNHSFYTNFEKRKPNYLKRKIFEKLSYELKRHFK
jgi:hypothetical protein